MDKRSIIFIICVSAAFLLANIYFTQQQQDQERQWNEYQKVKQERIEKEKAENIAARTKQAADLPLVELYEDNSASHLLGIGILDKNAILTIGWSNALPKIIYAGSYGGYSAHLNPYQINTNEAVDRMSLKGQPVVYSKDGKEHLYIADVPLFGTYDVQLVSFNGKQAEVGLGEIVDGKFESLRAQTSKQPPPAIALFESEGTYYPIGIVSGAEEKLTDLEDYDALHEFVEKSHAEKPAAVPESKEKFYVLENGYQQLVFSNVGGSLVEINLPFVDDNPSVVKPVEADRTLLEYSPQNARFPLEPYHLANEAELLHGQEGGYYPLIRRNFIEPHTLKERKVEPQYYALNIVSDYPELAQLIYTVKEFTSEKIVFEGSQRQRKITKTYTLAPTHEAAPYCFNLEVKVEGDARGLWLTSGLLEAEWVAGAIAPGMKYRITKKGEAVVESMELPSDSTINTSITPDWVANSNGFFSIIMDPLGERGAGWRAQKVPGTTVYSRLVALEREFPDWNAQDLPSYLLMIPLPQKGKSTYRLFAGPLSTPILKKVDNIYRNPVTKESPDYLAVQTFHGWFSFISEPFAKFLFWIMEFFYWITTSWGVSIILVTVVLRILLYPLNAWSNKSMQAMQRISPKVQALQEKYKNDKQKQQLEIMALYKKEKVNPFSGCLPMLIQMPFLIGMFDLLKSAFPLRGAVFIPGWIDDLSAPDVVFSWGYSIPFIGSEFHLLPIILGVVMFFQSRVGMAKVDVSKMTDAQRQQRASGTIMAIVFTVLFYKFPSGLNIYWLSSMLLGILQQWWSSKSLKTIKVL